MEYIDLNTGFALMGFDTYQEMQRVAQLCKEKHKAIAFTGAPANIREIQARSWVCPDTYHGFMDYNYPKEVHYKMAGSKNGPNKEGPKKAKESISSAIEALEQKMGYEVKLIIVCRK